MTEMPLPTLPTSPRQKPEQALLFLALVVVIFCFPIMPSYDLDASWRMALGKFFLDHLQFGRDVVFTYGPLGFLMGKTYSGLLFWSLLAGQAVLAVAFAALIRHWGQRLASFWPRFFYYAFFLLFGVCYEDALHMLMIALAGFELLRRVGRPWQWSSNLLLLLLAVLGVVKFTNLLLAAVLVGSVTALALWRRQNGHALRLAAWFAGGYLAGWVLCAQNPLNLPAYFVNSWRVSQGYQEAMGIATPDAPFHKALVILAVLASYLVLHLFTQRDRPRAIAGAAMLAALVFLNWKHGFVRADGHMVGFFYCALLPVVAYPVLLDDAAPFGRTKRWVLAGTGLLCIFGVRETLPSLVDAALAIFQGRIWTNVSQTARLTTLREEYDGALSHERLRYDMPRSRAIVGDHTIDVIGHNQAVALFSKFNYRPRPVFQSYSVYSPELARLNADYYNSDRAPDYVLLRVDAIDERLPAMDDSAVLYILMQRYEYVLTEKSFQLWKRVGGPLPADAAPQLLGKRTIALEEVWSLKGFNTQPLWVKVDLAPSLLGRLRTFFYKPPILRLALTDSTGRTLTYRMPAPIGRAGFMVNPLIEDVMSFTHAAAGKPERMTDSLMVTLAEADRKYFAPTVRVEVSAIKSSLAAANFFSQQNKERFHVFKSTPVSFDAANPPSIELIDGQEVMVVHAPSELTFDMPENATAVTGFYGFLEGAYINGNHTNGADFVIVWSDGRDTRELFHKFLDPLKKNQDRGLFPFRVDLTGCHGGRLYIRTLPGPYNDMGWDWTAWTAIEIK